MRRLPIRTRLTLGFAAAMFVLLVVMGAFVYLRTSFALDRSLDGELRSDTAEVSALERRDPKFLATTVTQLPGRRHTFSQVLSDGGRGTFDASPGLEMPQLTQAQYAAALKHPQTIERVRLRGQVPSPYRSLPYRLYARRITLPNGHRSLVVVSGVSTEKRDEALEQLIFQLGLASLLTLLLSSLIGYRVAGAALAPVERMRTRAAEISADGGVRRLPLPEADDEIARLGRTLNEMLARLEQAFERERTFVSDASHELRTPLALLTTELELALRKPRDPDELRDALESALAETERLSRLANDLLLIARSDQGRMSVRPVPIEARELLDDTARRFGATAEAGGRTLRVDCEDTVVFEADRLQLERAVANLVDNALHHGVGEVVLAGRATDGDRVELEVRDDGMGFPPEFLPEAFQRFSRPDEGRTGRGAGLGLAIVDAVARVHGGEAHARNLASGGAAVAIVLPRHPDSSE